MKILVLPSWYPPQGGGFFRDYCEAFLKKGNTVYVIAIEICPSKKIKVADVIQSLRIKVCHENGIIVLRTKYLKLPKLEKINALLWSRRLSKVCNHFIKKYPKPDIVHVHSAIWAGLTGTLVSEKYELPVVITEHRSRFVYNNPDALKMLKVWQLKLLKNVFNNNKATIVTVSSSLKQTISSRYSPVNDIAVIGNIVDFHFFKTSGIVPEGKFTFLTVANLESYKGIDILLHAFSIVLSKYPKVYLVIGGSGEMLGKLNKISSDLSISDNVSFLGQLSKEEVRNQMQSAKVFVSSSRFEAFGVAIVEAMACGLPVITTNSGGPEDIITNQNLGTIVDKNNPGALALAMETMYQNYSKYDKVFIRNYAISNYGDEVIIEKYMALFNHILSAKTF